MQALNEATTSTNFGVLSNGSYVMGELTTDDVDSMGFEELVTGFGWLLREGVVQVGAGGEIAPRTAIGSDVNGRLLIFEADGEETTYLGLTLQQLAQWGQQLGAYNLVCPILALPCLAPDNYSLSPSLSFHKSQMHELLLMSLPVGSDGCGR